MNYEMRVFYKNLGKKGGKMIQNRGKGGKIEGNRAKSEVFLNERLIGIRLQK